MSLGPLNVPPSGYPIGAVSRLNCIYPETSGVWERRFGWARPQRTECEGRLCGDEEIQRLSLVELLVDARHAANLIAALSREELEARLKTAPPAPLSIASGRHEVNRLAVGSD